MRFSIVKRNLWVLILAAMPMVNACTEYLDLKPRQSLVVPETLGDMEALLNNANIVKTGPALDEIMADNYYVDPSDWHYLLSQSERVKSYYGECLAYLWDPNAIHDSWNDTYRTPVYYANVVLGLLEEFKTEEVHRSNIVKGMALFYRAFAFERLAQIYCKPFSTTSGEDLGIVLRKTSDINIKPTRATVEETYEQIIHDMKLAADLLPAETQFPTHPNKAAAYGALARTYLSMREYQLAGRYADTCLSFHDELMDYNDYFPAGMPVFPEYNREVIYHAQPSGPGILAASRAKIADELYNSYDDNDLRKVLFFYENTGSAAGTFRFRGNYLGRFNVSGHQIFYGITTGEMFLIKAECHARGGEYTEAIKALNTLLRNRYQQGSGWEERVTPNKELLDLILDERRKELVFRGLRWSDLRRLNEEGRNITLSRDFEGKLYTLPPKDPRWVALIPEEAVVMSGLPQNPR